MTSGNDLIIDLLARLRTKREILESDAEEAIQEYDDEERSHACFAQIQLIDELMEYLNNCYETERI